MRFLLFVGGDARVFTSLNARNKAIKELVEEGVTSISTGEAIV